ncbi:MAG: DUF3576 domain-containing protein [Proteobacteria bacterium]|nr:DUF3576 domain-containing protein [Pseudomonadota bacterium]
MIKKIFSLLGPLLLVSCANQDSSVQKPPPGRSEQRKENFGKLFGDEFLFFGPTKKTQQPGSIASTVNPYLWRASLEAVSFMPLQSADAVGGVIITDWYVTPTAPKERMKIIIYINDIQLRADALKVVIFKQVQDKSGHWVAAKADLSTAHQLEDVILTKARQNRIATINASK